MADRPGINALARVAKKLAAVDSNAEIPLQPGREALALI
jgi:hypothetical protein